MNDLSSEFHRLPETFQKLILAVQETHQIIIDPLQQLSGGRSGALLYLVSVRPNDSQQIHHLVLKIDHVIKWSDEYQTEVERHRAAFREAPAEFASNNLAGLFYEPIERDGLLAILYTIAGGSIQQCRPVAAYTQRNHLATIFRTVSGGLLDDWQKEIVFRKALPQAMLQQWLSYRIKQGEGNIDDFLVNHCRSNPDDAGFIIEGVLFPNPLVYARDQARWNSARSLDAAVGFMHGDLHLRNVLVSFTPNGEDLQAYFFIDLANYESQAFLLYDHLYFEISYLIQQVNRTSFTAWMELISYLTKRTLTDSERMSPDLVGHYEVVNDFRSVFKAWVEEHHPTMTDDLQGQFYLAGVAAGLNFCNKLTLTPEERLAALIYSAAHLKAYCAEFGVPMLEQANQLVIANQDSQENSIDWDDFLQACHGFVSDRMYILIVGAHSEQDKAITKSIGRIAWGVVLDFDQDTQDTGLYSSAAEEVQARRSLQLLTSEEPPLFNMRNKTHWYAARGLKGRAATIPPDDTWLKWNRKYAAPLINFLNEVSSSTDETPVTVVILWDEMEYVRKTCELLDQSFSERAEYVFATNDAQHLSSSIPTQNTKVVPIDLRQVAIGIKKFINDVPSADDAILLPTSIASQPASVATQDVYWFQEELTLVHMGLGVYEEDGHEAGRDFLRGSKISWFELGLHSDVNRDKTFNLQRQVEDDLKERLTTRINLYHYPGAGGTTVALRVAWNTHRTSPTVLLHHVTTDTIGRLRKLFDYVGKSILAVVESTEVSPDALNALFSQVQSEHIPIVFLITTRRFIGIEGMQSPRVFYLQELLDQNEGNLFAKVYGQEEPSRRDVLIDLATMVGSQIMIQRISQSL